MTSLDEFKKPDFKMNWFLPTIILQNLTILFQLNKIGFHDITRSYYSVLRIVFFVFSNSRIHLRQKFAFFSFENYWNGWQITVFPFSSRIKRRNRRKNERKKERKKETHRLFSFKLKENLLFGLSHLVYIHIHPVSPKIVFQSFYCFFGQLKLTSNKI